MIEDTLAGNRLAYPHNRILLQLGCDIGIGGWLDTGIHRCVGDTPQRLTIPMSRERRNICTLGLRATRNNLLKRRQGQPNKANGFKHSAA
jgi:hypothetical protein